MRKVISSSSVLAVVLALTIILSIGTPVAPSSSQLYYLSSEIQQDRLLTMKSFLCY